MFREKVNPCFVCFLYQALTCKPRAGWAHASHSNLFMAHSMCLLALLRVMEEKLCPGSLFICHEL